MNWLSKIYEAFLAVDERRVFVRMLSIAFISSWCLFSGLVLREMMTIMSEENVPTALYVIVVVYIIFCSSLSGLAILAKLLE